MGLCCWSRNIQVPKKWAFSSSRGKGHANSTKHTSHRREESKGHAKRTTSFIKKMSFFKLLRQRPRQEHNKSKKKGAFSSSTEWKATPRVKGHAKNEKPHQEHNKSQKRSFFKLHSERPCQERKAMPRAQQVSKKGAFSSSTEWKATLRAKGHAKNKRPRQEHNKSQKRSFFKLHRVKGHAKSEMPRQEWKATPRAQQVSKKELFQAPQSERPCQEWKATPRMKGHAKSTTSLKKELFQAPQSKRPRQEPKATPRTKGHAKSTTSLKGHWACRFLPFQMRKWHFGYFNDPERASWLCRFELQLGNSCYWYIGGLTHPMLPTIVRPPMYRWQLLRSSNAILQSQDAHYGSSKYPKFVILWFRMTKNCKPVAL